jgi:hypothetical protein
MWLRIGAIVARYEQFYVIKRRVKVKLLIVHQLINIRFELTLWPTHCQERDKISCYISDSFKLINKKQNAQGVVW